MNTLAATCFAEAYVAATKQARETTVGPDFSVVFDDGTPVTSEYWAEERAREDSALESLAVQVSDFLGGKYAPTLPSSVARKVYDRVYEEVSLNEYNSWEAEDPRFWLHLDSEYSSLMKLIGEVAAHVDSP